MRRDRMSGNGQALSANGQLLVSEGVGWISAGRLQGLAADRQKSDEQGPGRNERNRRNGDPVRVLLQPGRDSEIGRRAQFFL